MTIEEMKQRKQELGYSYEQLSELSGVPAGTINKVLNGYTRAPRYATLSALEKALFPERSMQIAAGKDDALPGSNRVLNPALKEHAGWNGKKTENGSSFMVRDPGGSYASSLYKGQDGFHTRHELEELPENERMELIDGVLYDMASPATVHQVILLSMAEQFRREIRAHGCPGCRVFAAPLDVMIDRDDYTVVQPDLMIICHRDMIHEDGVYGAPDLTLEILSPSTKTKDQFIKLNKYRSSGVKEYWIVDPAKYTVTVYLLSVMRGEEEFKDNEITIYNFDDEIPVWISSGKCSINMRTVRDEIDELRGD